MRRFRPEAWLTALLSPPSPFDTKNPFLAVVTTNRKLNQGTERHLMHLELDISDSKIRYQLLPPLLPKPSTQASCFCTQLPSTLPLSLTSPPGMSPGTMWLFIRLMTLPW